MKPIKTSPSANPSGTPKVPAEMPALVPAEMPPVNRLRELPSVDEISNATELTGYQTQLNPLYLIQIIRNVLDDVRQQVLADNTTVFSKASILQQVIVALQRYIQPSLQPVINLSGTLIHTNLGRSVLPKDTINALINAASSPVNLEYDLAKGARGERDSHLAGLISLLTGAESATFVNNNAAAVLLTLNSLANRKEVIVSRGELIEIGGSFRLPDIMKKSGCKLVEVGTTNRTHLKDYLNAITPRTALILKAHTSNYQINGFVKEVDIRELVQIGKEHHIPVVYDLGSGALIDYAPFGLPKEVTVTECLALGVDVVLFSGDKLLGGPQAGIIAGKKEYIDKINRNPMKRAMRLDKLRIALLEAIFRIYLQPAESLLEIPLIRWLKRPIAEIESIAQQAAKSYQDQWGHLFKTEIQYDYSEVGSGSLPEAKLETVVLALTPYQWNLQKIASRFRENKPPIIGRIHQNKFLLDMRTVDDVQSILPNFGDTE